MKTLSLVVLALGASVAVAFSGGPAAAAAQCMELRFLDAKGVVVPVNPPIIGIAIGDTPLFEGLPPDYHAIETGRFVACPQPLLDSVNKVFLDSCVSEERRKAAAGANRVGLDVINKRCADMSNALVK